MVFYITAIRLVDFSENIKHSKTKKMSLGFKDFCCTSYADVPKRVQAAGLKKEPSKTVFCIDLFEQQVPSGMSLRTSKKKISLKCMSRRNLHPPNCFPPVRTPNLPKRHDNINILLPQTISNGRTVKTYQASSNLNHSNQKAKCQQTRGPFHRDLSYQNTLFLPQDEITASPHIIHFSGSKFSTTKLSAEQSQRIVLPQIRQFSRQQLLSQTPSKLTSCQNCSLQKSGFPRTLYLQYDEAIKKQNQNALRVQKPTKDRNSQGAMKVSHTTADLLSDRSLKLSLYTNQQTFSGNFIQLSPELLSDSVNTEKDLKQETHDSTGMRQKRLSPTKAKPRPSFFSVLANQRSNFLNNEPFVERFEHLQSEISRTTKENELKDLSTIRLKNAESFNQEEDSCCSEVEYVIHSNQFFSDGRLTTLNIK